LKPHFTRLRLAIGQAIRRFRFRIWRINHPEKSFSGVYAERAAREEQSSGRDFALIVNREAEAGQSPFSPRSVALAQRVESHLQRNGLNSGDRCVDFGCGSLRIGGPLIAYLDSSSYIGLDVTDAFYKAGLRHLDPAMLLDKAPRFEVISDQIIKEIGRNPPDTIFSFAVVQHVPPDEIQMFFKKITHLIDSRTVGWIYFKDADVTYMAKPDSWRYSASDLLKAVQAVAPEVSVSVFRDTKAKLELKIGLGFSALKISRAPGLQRPIYA
jgi:hypothetical protein